MHKKWLLLLFAFAAGSVIADLAVDSLRCEYELEPLGLNTATPRFTWTLSCESDVALRGQRQTGYEFEVAKSEADFGKTEALLWQCARQDSEPSLVYAGNKLEPGTVAFARLRVADAKGKFSPWSKPCRFRIALLSPEDWSGANWVTVPHTDRYTYGDCLISVRFILKHDAFGVFFRAKDERNCYVWQYNMKVSGKPMFRPHLCKNGQWNFLGDIPLESKMGGGQFDPYGPHTMDIELRGGKIRTAIDGKTIDERDSSDFLSGTVGFRLTGGESALVDELKITSLDGKVLLHDTFDRPEQCHFASEKLEKGQLVLNERSCMLGGEVAKNCPRLRKVFRLADKPIRDAFVSVCGLGFYELYVNGKKIGNRVTAPANTVYGRQVFFDSLEVTDALRCGEDNALGIWLAPGYSDDYSRWGWKWTKTKCAIAHLLVNYADGSRDAVVTDNSWQYCEDSPLSYASLYHGEVYDAAQDSPEWSQPGKASEGWKPVALGESAGVLLPAEAPPCRVVETRPPLLITEPRPGVFVADFGQNCAGWVRLRAKGPKGTKIVMRHSELLGKDGMIDPWTNRGAKSTDTFILAGTGEWESYEPRFTYHGFRYAEITGYPGKPTPDDLVQCAVHADLERAGRFYCSDDQLNWIMNAATWSMLSNLQGIPTDCPMRDERTPCQMDSQAYEDAALMYFWMPKYYNKWMMDIAGGTGNPDWNGDAVTLPWRLYREYGDRRFLERWYDAMSKQVESVLKRFPDYICKDGFGDWCAPNDGTWEGYHADYQLVNSALNIQCLTVMRNAAGVLGKTGESEKFKVRLEAAIKAFNAHFYHPDRHAYGDGSQTTSALPLAFGIVPDSDITAVAAQLSDTIVNRDRYRMDTGIFGTLYLPQVLCDIGRSDILFQMLRQPQYPGFRFMRSNGATTLWEQWTFRGGMNSHNHAMFSGVAAHFATRICGITPARPGYREIAFKPVFMPGLDFADYVLQTVRGECRCFWRRDNGGAEVEVQVPVNTEATLALPNPECGPVTESLLPVKQAVGVDNLGNADGVSNFRLQSGIYRFRVNRAF